MPNRGKTLSALAAVLLIAGGFVALISTPFLFFGWYTALNASSYQATSFEVRKVEYRNARRSVKHWVTGVVEGRTETIPLSEFGPTPASQSELERIFPSGTRFYVYYNPNAPGQILTGTALRVLPRHYPLAHALSRAIIRTLGCLGPLAMGIGLQTYLVQTEKRRERRELEDYLAQREAAKARKPVTRRPFRPHKRKR
jgi:hypothetical protein